MNTTTATRFDSRILAAAALALTAAALTPAMSEASAQAEASTISVEHQGEVTTIGTDDVDSAGFIFSGPRFGSREWVCARFPAIC